MIRSACKRIGLSALNAVSKQIKSGCPSAAAAGLRPYSETGPRPHTSLYPVVSEGTWLEKNNYAQFDGWELRQLINFVAADDGVPEAQSHLLVKMYNWHYGKMHFSSSLDCIANCASIYRHLYITALLYLGGESTFKFYWKLNFIISALIMHVLKKCTQIGENVLSQHKFGGAVQFCFDPFQGWGGC